MKTTADKLNHLINTKEGIQQELNRAYETEEISISDTFNSYIQKLEEHPFYVKTLVEGTIKNVNLPNATSIGTSAFSSCSGLTSVSFPEVIKISAGAFQNCSSLTSISFPKVSSIGYGTFQGCSSLTTIYVGTESDTVCTLSSTDAIPSSVTDIYVPATLVDRYKSATNWSTFASKIKATP